jgi:hypothetical protein
MALSLCRNDLTFGPIVEGCRNDFDFTLLFEQIFFAIVPTSMFLVLAVLRISLLSSKQRLVGGGWLLTTKFVCEEELSFVPFMLITT